MSGEESTRTKTLWTEQLLEDLFTALRQRKSDGAVLEVARELLDKGLPKRYLVQKVEQEVGASDAGRLHTLISRKGTAAARGKGPAKSSGLFKKLFK